MPVQAAPRLPALTAAPAPAGTQRRQDGVEGEEARRRLAVHHPEADQDPGDPRSAAGPRRPAQG